MNVTDVTDVSPARQVQHKPLVRSWRARRKRPLYVMLIPACLGLLLFNYLPMAGLVMVFQNYKPLAGFFNSPWVGFANFERLFAQPDFWLLIRNTLVIAVGKLALGQVASLVFALLLNEVTHGLFKRTVQTITYALYFLSWILFGGILLDTLGADGIVNQMVQALGLARVEFLTEPSIFPVTLITTDIWKSFGIGAVLYIAALADVDPALYDAAAVDGANRWHRLRYVTIPGILPTIIILACLNLGSVLSAGMDQVLVLYNPAVYRTGDIIDTFVYRMGLKNAQYSLAATVGLLQSAVAMVLITLSYYLANRFAKYRIF